MIGCLKLARDVAEFKEPTFKSPHNLMRNYGQAVNAGQDVARQIQTFMRKAYDVTEPIPQVAVAGADVAALPYEEALNVLNLRFDEFSGQIARMFECPRTGRFEWLSDDAARFSYVTVERERGLLKVKHHRTKHVHDLVKATSHRLTDGIPIRDPRAKQLIGIIPVSLRPYARVITGLEIVQGQEFAGTDETLTALGRMVESGKRAAAAAGQKVVDSGKKAATVIAHGAVAVGNLGADAARGAGRALSSGAFWSAAGIEAAVVGAIGLLGMMAQVIIADPALVVGEYVLHGWED